MFAALTASACVHVFNIYYRNLMSFIYFGAYLGANSVVSVLVCLLVCLSLPVSVCGMSVFIPQQGQYSHTRAG